MNNQVQGEQTMYICLQAHIYDIKLQYFHHSRRKYGGIHKQTNRKVQVIQENIH